MRIDLDTARTPWTHVLLAALLFLSPALLVGNPAALEAAPASAPETIAIAAAAAGTVAGALPQSPSIRDPEIRAIHTGQELVERGGGDERYDQAGRRDPFVDPRSALPPDTTSARPGLPGMLLGEVRIQGLTLVNGEPEALVLGSDGLGYTLREADSLRDARVVTIDFATTRIVFQQDTGSVDGAPRYRVVVRELAR